MLTRAQVYGSHRRTVLSGAREITPASFPALEVWIEARKEFSYAEGAGVTTATDWSGNGNDFAEATNPPTFKAGVVFGRAGFRFNGTNQLLTGSPTVASAMTIYVSVVRNGERDPGNPRIVSHGGPADLNDQSTYAAYYANQAGVNQNIGSSIASARVIALSFASTSSVTPYIDGAPGSAFDPNDNYDNAGDTALGAQTGGSNFGKVDIGAFLIYLAAHDAGTVSKLTRYLGA